MAICGWHGGLVPGAFPARKRPRRWRRDTRVGHQVKGFNPYCCAASGRDGGEGGGEGAVRIEGGGVDQDGVGGAAEGADGAVLVLRVALGDLGGDGGAVRFDASAKKLAQSALGAGGGRWR